MAAKPEIYITHHSEEKFLERFREDLANSMCSVVILSPFVSQNRAVHYYPVLHALTFRNVLIDVYTRPKAEQPVTLQEQFNSVERTFYRIGAHFHLRPGMHEKIAVIDDRVLWHGSLNILSHNDTRESMLRFDFPDLVRDIMSDLGLPYKKYPLPYKQYPDEEVYMEAADPPVHDSTGCSSETRPCLKCKGQMHFFENAGLWICDNSPGCSETMPFFGSPPTQGREEEKGQDKRQRLNLPCPLCRAPLEITRGVFVLAACTSKDCGFTLDHRLSASLNRILNLKKE